MKLTVALKLRPTSEQAIAPRDTLTQANRAANRISAAAWHTRTFQQLRRFVAYKARRAGVPVV